MDGEKEVIVRFKKMWEGVMRKEVTVRPKD